MQFNLIDLWCCDKYRLKLYLKKNSTRHFLIPYLSLCSSQTIKLNIQFSKRYNFMIRKDQIFVIKFCRLWLKLRLLILLFSKIFSILLLDCGIPTTSNLLIFFQHLKSYGLKNQCNEYNLKLDSHLQKKLLYFFH